jgi:hypothetical protein
MSLSLWGHFTQPVFENPVDAGFSRALEIRISKIQIEYQDSMEWTINLRNSGKKIVVGELESTGA